MLVGLFEPMRPRGWLDADSRGVLIRRDRKPDWERMTPHLERHFKRVLRLAEAGGAQVLLRPGELTPDSAGWWGSAGLGNCWVRWGRRGMNSLEFFMAPVRQDAGPLERPMARCPVDFTTRSNVDRFCRWQPQTPAFRRAPDAELLAKKLWRTFPPTTASKQRAGRSVRRSILPAQRPPGRILAMEPRLGAFPIGSRRHQKPHNRNAYSWVARTEFGLAWPRTPRRTVKMQS